MTAANNLQEPLRRVGLTAYESEAYLALLSKRELTAEDVARQTSIPITRVYGTLEQLMQKGFARIIQSRPKRFHAVPPVEAKREYLTHLRAGLRAKSSRGGGSHADHAEAGGTNLCEESSSS